MALKRRFLLPLIAAILAGCGSTHTPVGAHAVTAAQRQLITEADPICAAASAKRAAANASLGARVSFSNPKTMFNIAQTAPGVAAAESNAVVQLRKLKAPASLAHDWQAMLTGLQQLATATAKLAGYAKENNPQSAQEVVAGTQATRKQLGAIAARDGFANCGRND